MEIRSVYAAFEVYPSCKGSGTHMDHMIDVLQSMAGNLVVCCLPGFQEFKLLNGHIGYYQYDKVHEHYLDRALSYSTWLKDLVQGIGFFDTAQYRDIWSAIPLIESKRCWHTVFEVNGLPSIELSYRYPDLGEKTIQKILDLEQFCLEESDRIICPSGTIRQYLVQREIDPEKISVITNGADLPVKYPKPSFLPHRYLLYFGALQDWQGLDTLFRAFSLVRDFEDLHLVICSSNHEKLSRPYKSLAEKLHVSHRIHWYYLLDKSDLLPVIQHALFSLAPLKETARNTVQGCSPLKILESMACGTPVLASDLPAVREIITDGVDGKLARADRPSEWARAIRLLLDYPEFCGELGRKAAETITGKFLWKDKKKELSLLYNECLVT